MTKRALLALLLVSSLGACGSDAEGRCQGARCDGAPAEAGASGATPMRASGSDSKDSEAVSAPSGDAGSAAGWPVKPQPQNYDPMKPYRLILAWHGLGGSAQQIARGGYYGLQIRSQNGAIFVACHPVRRLPRLRSGLSRHMV